MNVRAMKSLVIAMGVLLILGFVALVATIAVRLSHRGPAPAVAFTAPPVALPPGAKIERMSTGPDRIVLAIALPDGTRQLLVIDLQTGRLLGTIPIAER
jgi:hypothetical protein